MSYGLLGRTLGHSFSPQIHKALAGYDYTLFEREPETLDDFFANGSWQGINVTIPYKETVMPYCTRIDAKAQAIGCVNTIVREADGSLSGYNTDYDGFRYSLEAADIAISGKKCLILGNGATSKTIETVLRDLGATSILHIARRGGIPFEQIDQHHDAQVIVNATPVGMYPHTPARLINLDGFDKLEAVFDAIYNPHRTQLLLDAAAKGIKTCNGLSMLVAQAAYAAQYFVGGIDIHHAIPKVLSALQHEAENIVLIGMPGVGKSSVGRALSEALNRPFIDSDKVFEERYGSPANYITTHGVDAFRQLESEILAELGKAHGQIIATGGGVVTIPANKALLKQNGRIYWLERPLEVLSTRNRPLSQGGLEGLKKLYQERHDLYQDFADVHIDHNGIERTACIIQEEFYEAMRH